MEPSPVSRSGRARTLLRAHPETHFVDSEQFLRLLVSPRPMDRLDDVDAGVLGLCDRSTGERYFIEEERIPSPAVVPPPAAS